MGGFWEAHDRDLESPTLRTGFFFFFLVDYIEFIPIIALGRVTQPGGVEA